MHLPHVCWCASDLKKKKREKNSSNKQIYKPSIRMEQSVKVKGSFDVLAVAQDSKLHPIWNKYVFILK